MPHLSIQTNVSLTPNSEAALLADAAGVMSAQLGKPEAYIMVSLAPVQCIRFAGSDAPAAFLEIKSIGLPRTLNAAAAALTVLVTNHLQVAPDRVFIVFNNVSPTHWGHNGDTFA